MQSEIQVPYFCWRSRRLVVRHVEEEPVGTLDTRLDRADRCVADAEPPGVRPVEVHDWYSGARRARRPRLEHREPIRGGGRRIGLGRLAPLELAVDGRVPGNDAEAVGLEDDDCVLVADALGESVDPATYSGLWRRRPSTGRSRGTGCCRPRGPGCLVAPRARSRALCSRSPGCRVNHTAWGVAITLRIRSASAALPLLCNATICFLAPSLGTGV